MRKFFANWRWAALICSASLAACSALPDKPVRSTLYDFGPSVAAAPSTASSPSEPSLVLHDMEAAGALDGSAILYRLGYADDRQLKPYSQARWSAPPPQLVRQRLRQQLGQNRAILDPADSAALARNGTAPRVMRVDLEEFSHLFDSPNQSWGLLRLRVTLMDNTPAGEKLLAQKTFAIREPAPTPDAAGGVRALAAATDAAAREIAQWLQNFR
jgi:cholesterol transport system auxiliary component